MLTVVCHQAGGEVTVKGVREIVAVMRYGASDQKLRATVALTNVLPDSDSNRMNAHAAGQSCFVLCVLCSHLGDSFVLCIRALEAVSVHTADFLLRDSAFMQSEIRYDVWQREAVGNGVFLTYRRGVVIAVTAVLWCDHTECPCCCCIPNRFLCILLLHW